MEYRNFSIVSASLATLTNEQNDLRALELINSLQALNVFHVPVIGVYKGIQEKSVFIAGPENQQTAQNAAIRYNQESYIHWGLQGLLLTPTNETLLTFKNILVVEDTEGLEAYTVLPGFGNVIFV